MAAKGGWAAATLGLAAFLAATFLTLGVAATGAAGASDMLIRLVWFVCVVTEKFKSRISEKGSD